MSPKEVVSIVYNMCFERLDTACMRLYVTPDIHPRIENCITYAYASYTLACQHTFEPCAYSQHMR